MYIVVIVLVVTLAGYAFSLPDTDGAGDERTPPTTEAAPDFQLVSIDGDPVSLDKYRGRVVVLDLFATWCGPCRTQMVELNKLRAVYPEHEVVILSVDVDQRETEQQIRDFRDQYNADWAFATDTDYLGDKYDAQSIPTMAIIDKDGGLAWRHVGVTDVDELKSRIEPLL